MTGRLMTAQDGDAALRGHLLERATLARERHGPIRDLAAIERVLADRDVVRFDVRVVFDAEALLPGEFAWVRARGERPADGFDLVVHPHYEHQHDVLPLLLAYHIVAVNYLDVATNREAELFGATLLGLDVDQYYTRLCELADALPGALDAPGRAAVEATAASLGIPLSGAPPAHAVDPVAHDGASPGGCGLA